MPKQSLLKRIERLASDALDNNGTLDFYARWDKIVKDGVGADCAKALGNMPQPTLDDVDIKTAIDYAARDADATLRLYPILSQKIDEMGLRRALEIDEAVVPMVVRMMQNGMLVDKDHLGTLQYAFDDALSDLEYRAHQAVGRRFLLTSGDQVADVLYGDLGLGGRRKTRSGKRLSTDEKALQALKGQHPVISLILEHREISKLQSSYVEKLPKLLSLDGRIRMELGMTTVPSGRLNCWGGVNLLAIPVMTDLGREIRRAFIASEGCLLGSVDLNQIELRAMAILSGDERMLDAFATGKDLHRLTASEAIYHIPFDSVDFEQRQRGKTMNFAIANQISPLGLLDQFIISGATDMDEVACAQLLEKWFSFYDKVPAWFDSVYEEGRRNGYIRDSLSGRIIYTPGLRSPIDKVREHAERVATNWKIQTFAQVCLKLGMALLWEWLPTVQQRCEPLLQVHDEILWEIDKDFDGGSDITALVEAAVTDMPIPIKAVWHTGANWKELK